MTTTTAKRSMTSPSHVAKVRPKPHIAQARPKPHIAQARPLSIFNEARRAAITHSMVTTFVLNHDLTMRLLRGCCLVRTSFRLVYRSKNCLISNDDLSL